MIRALLLAALASAPARDVEIVGMDYAFRVPSELPAGLTNFGFVNKGKVKHELNIVLLKPGATLAQYVAVSKSGESVYSVVESPVGVLFADPSKRSPSALTTQLLAGRTYVVQCIFRDSATAPRHAEMGMISAISVTGSAASAAVKADTVVGMDYAFQYPRTMSPGVHHIAFVNKGKQRHEVALALLKRGVTLKDLQDADKAGKDVDPLFDENLGLLHARAGTTPVGLLRVNLLRGREYVIECGFADDEKSKPHYMLGMVGSIRVGR
jgi:hypothetical protein